MKPKCIFGITVAILFISMALFSNSVAAQSFFVEWGKVLHEKKPVANIYTLPVTLEWLSSREALLTYEDQHVRLQGTVDVESPDFHLMVGVGENIRLEESDGWDITLLAGSWVPVNGGGKESLRVVLPHDFPVKTGTIRIPVKPALALPTEGPYDFGNTDRKLFKEMVGMDLENRGVLDRTHLYKNMEDEKSWEVRGPVPKVISISEDGRWAHVAVNIGGFLIKGYFRFCKPSSCGKQLFSDSHPAHVFFFFDTGEIYEAMSIESDSALFSNPSRPGDSVFAVIKQPMTGYVTEEKMKMIDASIKKSNTDGRIAFPLEIPYAIESGDTKRIDSMIVFDGYAQITEEKWDSIKGQKKGTKRPAVVKKKAWKHN